MRFFYLQGAEERRIRAYLWFSFYSSTNLRKFNAVKKYGEIWSISLYSIRMMENTDQENSEYGHFSCTVY